MLCAGVAIAILFIFKGGLYLQDNYLTIGVGLTLFILRDIFGKSLGKYLLGMTIVDSKTQNTAKFYQRLLKNITAPLSIIEIPMIIFAKDNKRIGDRLAKTELLIDEDSYALKIFNTIPK
jgi:uncharacterized RDD family membrane protein YckC